MAKRIVTTLVDDFTGEEAHKTIAFSVDGRSYEIDLSETNAVKFREALQPYVEAGRRAGRSGKPKVVPASSEDSAQIREWARANGYEVNDRGRVAATIREAYEKANG
ncbi:Lsr2 family protein [Streptomyces sp. NPDC000594]|uniref:histone-like nucleoid-structuring protein Lsr2 n=1 Tax=Streptomyces sp. NPDC000594 TaxID=3154261 RepID=UPI0033244124